jgi:hypothetical protein
VQENRDPLVIAALPVTRSYGQNVRQPTDERFDTVQFYPPAAHMPAADDRV